MASVIGWLDYSEDHRQKMREIIDLFRDRDTLDEIGIGSVRDAFSELLFPGLSTVQTRARYFLFIPWVYKRMESERTASSKASDRARHLQTELIKSLERGGASGGEGIIGWDARQHLQRLPSAVYWAGLGAFGIRQFHGSIEDYHRSLDSYQDRIRHFSKGDGDEISERLTPNWTPHLPAPPANLWKESSIELTAIEANFLIEQIRLHRPDSLLAFYLDNPENDLTGIRAPWGHPAASHVSGETELWLSHARLFAEVINGAALVYNLMLAERAEEIGLSMGDGDLAEEYHEDLQAWVDTLQNRWKAVESWDLDEFWNVVRTGNPRVPHPTQAFVHRWITLALRDPEQIELLPPEVRNLIRDRELRLKGAQARLQSHRALEMWTGRSGVGVLTYRWPTARTIIADIHQGLVNA
ncbi:MAG: hypothetical protein IIC72_11930 [Acidobacteria bacterium]|nr:hypothetical protein [Acidobacteriota bacterium]